ncbi:hypothetical protein FJT64_022790 [Amphibalanus amphitrite]|uniref:Uncharacterized protein n=1 Tax=Amphibalanus amphitrite TaxID=1232801 RepID=A0A6A4WPB0_AMPAM|nr:hypothetical protein FJT64_022790 [Amphibalanus amphitrite]
MDDAALKEAITRILKDDVFVDIIRDQVRAAVDSAVAARDEEIEALKEELAETRAQLNGLEQYSRRLCLDVSGIPETPNEDTDRLVMDTARLAGVDVSKTDIDRSHRVGAVKPGRPRTLLVRFVSYAKREAFYGARRQLRQPRSFEGSTVTTAVASKVFVTDNLTRENQHILYRARQFRKEGKLFAAWSDVGKLKVRLRENGPTTVIRTMTDLQKLVNSAAERRKPQAPMETDGDGFRRVTRGNKSSAK